MRKEARISTFTNSSRHHTGDVSATGPQAYRLERSKTVFTDDMFVYVENPMESTINPIRTNK